MVYSTTAKYSRAERSTTDKQTEKKLCTGVMIGPEVLKEGNANALGMSLIQQR